MSPIVKRAATPIPQQAPAPAQAPQPVQEEIDLTQLSMMDVAGLNIGDFEEVRYETLPVGLYGFEVTQPNTTDELVDDPDDASRQVKRFQAEFKLKVLDVRRLALANLNPADYVGKNFSHRISQFIRTQKDISDFIGKVRAFLADIGVSANGPFLDVVNSSAGLRFIAPIKHTTKKGDTSVKYANLDTNKGQIRPYS